MVNGGNRRQCFRDERVAHAFDSHTVIKSQACGADHPHMSVDPGWYPDPTMTGGSRWWDGAAWTGHVSAPQPPAAAMSTVTANPVGAWTVQRPVLPVGGARQGIDAFAVIALVVGFLPQIGVLALAAGGYALHRMKANGQRGRILAIIGMTFGALWGVVLLLSAAKGHPTR